MYILIIGGGKVGYYLAKTLFQAGHDVGVIEQDSNRCHVIANDLDILVIHGDGTDIEVLEQANIKQAGYFVAATGKDEENLVACQLAKKYFQVPQTIARVNNPKNQAILQRLGVDATVSSTGIIAQMIQNQLAVDDVKTLPLFEKGDIELVETELKATSPVVNRAVREVGVPAECVLIAVVRGGKVLFPRGDTVLQAGDLVMALAKKQFEPSLKNILVGAK
ncbi:trk system potassium uptake protein TrkA [Hydrogenispora ethanolica]|jgi:trk system potassium uptake protein TrkA|uniref:Trk system potassium uptake protein TrkA n=1 Tax=Hydrogenispora ethanolica TaxID=1082276 RepID=A0A4R1RXT1_HYDET|nr:TrkA family potassium uptake protein [Hydrogenispora ethanolica]TCL71565.1 trk system potassium uptake protein TrkA [Hydrogenispora ethanolica]